MSLERSDSVSLSILFGNDPWEEEVQNRHNNSHHGRDSDDYKIVFPYLSRAMAIHFIFHKMNFEGSKDLIQFFAHPTPKLEVADITGIRYMPTRMWPTDVRVVRQMQEPRLSYCRVLEFPSLPRLWGLSLEHVTLKKSLDILLSTMQRSPQLQSVYVKYIRWDTTNIDSPKPYISLKTLMRRSFTIIDDIDTTHAFLCAISNSTLCLSLAITGGSQNDHTGDLDEVIGANLSLGDLTSGAIEPSSTFVEISNYLMSF
jgi:hypothetical protein